MDVCAVGQVTPVRLDERGDHFRRYRLRVPQAVQAMAVSLRRWGQCAPIVATVREERPQVLDGFTRWEAARQVRGMSTLLVRLIEVDDRRAKAAIYGLNQSGRRPYELEEAWIVQSLVRDDGLTQVEVAELLGRHKSWVCRRLALLEKLGAEVRQDLEVGLLTPTAAREIARLPMGNQLEVLDVSRREALNRDELAGAVRLLPGAVAAEQKLFVLTKPREALGQAGAPERKGWDPRLSAGGDRVSQQLAVLLDRLAWAENFLECRRWTALVACDRLVPGPVFMRLARDAQRVAEGAGDPGVEMSQPGTMRRAPRSWPASAAGRRSGGSPGS